MELTLRKEKVLSSVVTGFVRSGEPVGSKPTPRRGGCLPRGDIGNLWTG